MTSQSVQRLDLLSPLAGCEVLTSCGTSAVNAGIKRGIGLYRILQNSLPIRNLQREALRRLETPIQNSLDRRSPFGR